jgi:UDP-N-acetylglucosamine:LPS N-acetylglucosamine transferase
MQDYINKADKIFFPPITENEILKKYKKNSHKINFIITEFKKKKIVNNKIIGIIMDNGTKSNSKNISNILPYLKKLNKIKFYIQADNFLNNPLLYKIAKDSKNIELIYGNKNIHSKLPLSNFVIARGGFNTISECLVLKKPSLLIEEPKNPEIKKNLTYVFKKKYSVPLLAKDLSKNIITRLNKFLNYEYIPLKKRLNEIQFKSNGARQIYKEILKDIEK